MPRVKRGNVRRAKRKKLLARAKGFYQTKSKLYRSAKESVDTALKYTFVGRRRKKRDFRRLWVVRINAAARENGITYRQLIAGLKAAGQSDRPQAARRSRGVEPCRVRAAREDRRRRDAHDRNSAEPRTPGGGCRIRSRPSNLCASSSSGTSASAGTEADLRSVRDKYLSRKGGLVSGLAQIAGLGPG